MLSEIWQRAGTADLLNAVADLHDPDDGDTEAVAYRLAADGVRLTARAFDAAFGRDD